MHNKIFFFAINYPAFFLYTSASIVPTVLRGNVSKVLFPVHQRSFFQEHVDEGIEASGFQAGNLAFHQVQGVFHPHRFRQQAEQYLDQFRVRGFDEFDIFIAVIIDKEKSFFLLNQIKTL